MKKKKINKGKVEKEIEKGLLLFFLGFMGGMVYYHSLIKEDTVLAYNEPIKEVVEEEYILEEVCYLDSVSCKIKKVADKYNLDWRLLVAISKHETGDYTSYAFKELNNVGGLMYWDGKKSSLQSFNTLDEGIEKYVRNLKYNYFDKGLDTIEEIQKKYAPIGAANDPSGLNNYWVKGVSNYYKSLAGK